MSKTHWKKLVNPDYLGAYSLEEGQDLTVTIIEVVREKVKGSDGKSQECTVAKLKGQKPMIINRTNAKMITKVVGTPYVEDWAGQSIILYATKVRAFGDMVEALRVRNKKPTPAKLEEIHPKHKSWNACKKAIQSGDYTITDIKKKYSITPENEKALCNTQKTSK